MTGNPPRHRERAQPCSFRGGPAVASLFRAARHAVPPLETPRLRHFVVPQSADHPVDAKI